MVFGGIATMKKISINKGVTLLEILLSLVVLSILAASFLPMMQKMQLKRSLSIAALQINTITNAAIQYYNIYQTWPRDLNVLVPLLGYNGSTASPFCSVWKNKQGSCVPYTLTSGSSGRYFSLSVAVPNQTVAMQLIKSLPSAYWDSTTMAVVTYTTTFRGFKPPPPTGVLLSATSAQLHGNCTSSDAVGPPTSYYQGSPSPFKNCVSAASSKPLPYGLIDVVRQPTNTITAGNNYGSTNGFHASSYLLTDFACPAGSWPTMLLLPVGVLEAVPTSSGAPAVFPDVFNYSDEHFITQSKSGNINYESCVSATIGTKNPQSTVGSAPRYNGNFFANFGDVVCLPTSAVQRWPDGSNVGSCSANQ